MDGGLFAGLRRFAAGRRARAGQPSREREHPDGGKLYSTYNVAEGNAMYLAPEKRIAMWGENA